MTNKGITNLIFDLGGVLVGLDRRRCIENFCKLGFPDMERSLDVSHRAEGLLMQYEKGLVSSSGFRAEIRKRIGREVGDDRIDAAWNSFLVGIPAYKLRLLLKLRDEYAVYLLSNTNEIHWQWICGHLFTYRTFRVGDFFRKTYLSFEMKMAKPDPAIFRAVLEDAGIAPHATLFIDDSEANCRTARGLGITACTVVTDGDWNRLFPTHGDIQ